MIAEIFPEFYDVQGRRVSNPGTRGRRIGFHPGSMGRHLAGPLTIQCKDFADMRRFFATCRGRSRKEISKRDYWQAPHEFEKTRVGNCVDFSLWAWRQLFAMGYAARFVVGEVGKFSAAHAWVTFEKGGRWFLLEPGRSLLGLRMPRLSTLRYHPKFSAAWDGEKVLYFEHEDRNTDPRLGSVPRLVAEWLLIWVPFWIRFFYHLPFFLARRLWAKLRPPHRPS
jgi:hypothetical protein